MELVPAVTAWLSSKQRLLKRDVQDAVSNPADFVDKRLAHFNEDMKPEQVFDLEVWKRELASQGKELIVEEVVTAVLGKALGPAKMAAAKASSVLTPILIGAFRLVESKLLPSQLGMIKKSLTPVPYEGPKKWDNPTLGKFRAEESKLLPSTLQGIKKSLTPDPKKKVFPSLRDPDLELAKSIEGKISDKALQNYGTEKFPLDPYLAHVRGGMEGSAEDFKDYLKATELPLSVYRQDAQDYIAFSDLIKRKEAAGKSIPLNMREGLLAYKDDLRAYRSALSEKVPVFRIEMEAGVADIQEGASNLANILKSSPYSPDQLSKKSLEQLVSIGKKTEAAQLKEAFVIKDFTVKRSAQLNQEQGLPKGFVELKTQQDLGAETEFMNNCVGAGGAHPQTGKFIPKWHPITGEQITKGFAEDSGDQYWKQLQSGNERIFSYRPEGLPAATIRMDTRTGEVIEALGVENRSIPASMAKEIKLFTDQKRREFLGFPLAAKYKRIALDDPFAHNVPRAIDRLIRPRGEGAVQVAAWEAEQAALRAARELNPPPGQIEFGDF